MKRRALIETPEDAARVIEYRTKDAMAHKQEAIWLRQHAEDLIRRADDDIEFWTSVEEICLTRK